MPTPLIPNPAAGALPLALFVSMADHFCGTGPKPDHRESVLTLVVGSEFR